MDVLFPGKSVLEVIGEKEILEKLDRNKCLNVYWGTAPTSPPHLAYYLPLLLLRDLIRCRKTSDKVLHRSKICNVNILLADVHSYLDEGIHAYNRTEQRTVFYEHVIRRMMKVIGVEEKEYEITKGSQYQFDRRYCIDLYKFTTLLNVQQAKHASSEVVKKTKTPLLSGLLYPLMQCLDETYFDADIQLGGNDQRKIFMLSRDYIEYLGYEKCSYVITPLIPSLNGKDIKMSSRGNQKIGLMDDIETIRKKISKAYCAEKETDVSKNPLLALLKYIVFGVQERFDLIRDQKWGGDRCFTTYEEFEKEWSEGTIGAVDLKTSLIPCIELLIAPVREYLTANPRLVEDAYGGTLLEQ